MINEQHKITYQIICDHCYQVASDFMPNIHAAKDLAHHRGYMRLESLGLDLCPACYEKWEQDQEKKCYPFYLRKKGYTPKSDRLLLSELGDYYNESENPTTIEQAQLPASRLLDFCGEQWPAWLPKLEEI